MINFLNTARKFTKIFGVTTAPRTILYFQKPKETNTISRLKGAFVKHKSPLLDQERFLLCYCEGTH